MPVIPNVLALALLPALPWPQSVPSPADAPAQIVRERLVIATFDEQGVPAGMGDVVADMIIRAVDAPGFELLERRQVRRVLEEQAFATSDLTQPGEAVRYGRLADTRFVLVGTVYRLDGVYLVSARMVDSETGIVRESGRAVVQFRTVDEMASKVAELARLLGLRVGPEPVSPGSAPSRTPSPRDVTVAADPTTVRDLLERVGGTEVSSAPLSVSTPSRAIPVGGPVPLRVRSDRGGFLSLLVVDAGGGVRMLLPNARTPRFAIRSGQSVSVPGDLPFTLRAAPPLGVTRIKAVVTRDPIALSAGDGADELLRTVSLSDAVGAAGAATAWSAGELEFIVVPTEGDAAAPRLPSPPPSGAPSAAPAPPAPPEAPLPASRAHELVSSALRSTLAAGRDPDERARAILRWPLRSVFDPGIDIAWTADAAPADGVPLIGVIDADFDPDDPCLARAFAAVDDGTRASLRDEIRRNGRPPYRHGNRVCSLIAGDAPGLPSVVPGARIVPVRMTTDPGVPSYRADHGGAAELIDALRSALRSRCRVINVSLHVPLSGARVATFVEDPVWEDLERAGVLVVCAAGNRGEDLDVAPNYPQCIDRPNILCVGAVGPGGELASWGDAGSAWGARNVDLVAPGTALVVSDGGGRFDVVDGTSYACALATGVAARMMAGNPGLGPAEVIERMVRESRPLAARPGAGPICRGGLLTCPAP
jgi:hypothetical protein